MSKGGEQLGATRRGFIGGAVAVPFFGMAGLANAQAETAEAPQAELALRLQIEVEEGKEIGRTPYGSSREVRVVGGRFDGPAINGRILSGRDFQVLRNDGFSWLDATAMLEAEDGTLFRLHDRGLMNIFKKDAEQFYWRTMVTFEAPMGPHQWLNEAMFIGTFESWNPDTKTLGLAFYRLV